MRLSVAKCSCLALTLAIACSTIDVTRVKPGDYTTKGFRFYLPRPYVSVKKSFPVGGETAFLLGTVEDGRITGIDTTALPEPIARAFAPVNGKGTISVGQVLVAMQRAEAPGSPADGALEQADDVPAADKPKELPAAAWLSKSRVTPETLQPADSVYSLDVVIAADQPFKSIKSDDLEIGVCALSAGSRRLRFSQGGTRRPLPSLSANCLLSAIVRSSPAHAGSGGRSPRLGAPRTPSTQQAVPRMRTERTDLPSSALIHTLSRPQGEVVVKELQNDDRSSAHCPSHRSGGHFKTLSAGAEYLRCCEPIYLCTYMLWRRILPGWLAT